jgi:hypothetical protein
LCKKFLFILQSYSHLRPSLRLYLAYTLTAQPATRGDEKFRPGRLNHNEYCMLCALIKKVFPFKVNDAQMKTHLSICLAGFFLRRSHIIKVGRGLTNGH